MNSDFDRKQSRHFRIIRFGDKALLAGSFAAAIVSSIGVAGFVWPEFSLVRRYALTFAVFVSPVFLALSVMELTKQGRNGRRYMALFCSAGAVALVGLALHEVLSTHPILRHA